MQNNNEKKKHVLLHPGKEGSMEIQEKEVSILVKKLAGENGKSRYQFWDIERFIPRPEPGSVVFAEIKIGTVWEKMYWNKMYGKRHDRECNEGSYLVQKQSKGFETIAGKRTFEVRYWVH